MVECKQKKDSLVSAFQMGGSVAFLSFFSCWLDKTKDWALANFDRHFSLIFDIDTFFSKLNNWLISCKIYNLLIK